MNEGYCIYLNEPKEGMPLKFQVRHEVEKGRLVFGKLLLDEDSNCWIIREGERSHFFRDLIFSQAIGAQDSEKQELHFGDLVRFWYQAEYRTGVLVWWEWMVGIKFKLGNSLKIYRFGREFFPITRLASIHTPEGQKIAKEEGLL